MPPSGPPGQGTPGDTYQYNPPKGQLKGLGESARGTALVSDMADLDLMPGDTVIYCGWDIDSQWPMIEWTDGAGNPRITCIHPGTWNSSFDLVKPLCRY